MKTFRLSLLVWISLLGVSTLWAGDPWKEKPWEEWSQKDVEKILLNSPWAKKISLNYSRLSGSDPMGKPLNYEGLTNDQAENEAILKEGQRTAAERRSAKPPPGSAFRAGLDFDLGYNFTLRWFSSRTIQQGLIRNWQLQLNALPPPEEVQEFLQRQNPKAAQDPDALKRAKTRVEQHRAILKKNIAQMEAQLEHPKEYFEVVASPFLIPETSIENLKEISYLQPKKSKDKILPAKIEISGRSLIFYFPRQTQGRPVIQPEEKKVKFFTNITNIKIKTDFDLRKMFRDGKPDL